MKLSIFIFLLVILVAGSMVAEENGAMSSLTFTAAEAGFTLDYGRNQIAEHAIDERIIDRLGLFDASDSNQSNRYNVELDLENEDNDWSFEVTVTIEF